MLDIENTLPTNLPSEDEMKYARGIIRRIIAGDDMVIDGNGSLYVALFGGSRIEKISGTTGKILRKIYLPVPNVTSLCFIDENFRKLLVTTGAYNTDLKQYPFAGGVFKIFLNDRGD